MKYKILKTNDSEILLDSQEFSTEIPNEVTKMSSSIQPLLWEMIFNSENSKDTTRHPTKITRISQHAVMKTHREP